MPSYRAYRLSPAGKIVSGDWIEAENEAQAKALAHELCNPQTPAVELWLGAKCIARLPCNDDDAEAAPRAQAGG